MHGGATGGCFDGKSAAHAPGNAKVAVGAATVDRSTNGRAQQHDRAGHEVAPRRRDPTGGSARIGGDSAQQIIAEVGAQASTFPSAAELTSWVGTCPGKEESAEQNHSSRSAKGNKYLRRVLNQAAHAAVTKKGSYFQVVFRRLLPRLGYKSAIWAIAHRLCRLVWKILHEGVRFIERGTEVDPKAKKERAQMLARALRKLGYQVTITPINQVTATNAI